MGYYPKKQYRSKHTTFGSVKRDNAAKEEVHFGGFAPDDRWANKFVIYNNVGSLYQVTGQNGKKYTVSKVIGDSVNKKSSFEIDVSRITMLFIQPGDKVDIVDGSDFFSGTVQKISNDMVTVSPTSPGEKAGRKYEINVQVVTDKSKLLIYNLEEFSKIANIEE